VLDGCYTDPGGLRLAVATTAAVLPMKRHGADLPPVPKTSLCVTVSTSTVTFGFYDGSGFVTFILY